MFDEKWWRELFACVDAKDTRRFLTYLHPDAMFRYGSTPPAIGHAAIGSAVGGFFDSIRSSTHRLGRSWQEHSSAICQGEVTYVRQDGAEVTLPFCNVLSVSGDKVARYEIYIDPTPLISPAAA